MAQLHKRFTTEQVKLILEWFDTGTITEAQACERLGVKRRRFFMLLARWREDRERFSIAYGRTTPNRRIDPGVERCIKQELEADRKLIDDPDIPIRHYNYSAIRDGVTETTGRSVSVNTVINRAKDWEYYIAPPPKQPHDREVLTGAVGMLLQHDTSHHLWSPFAASKWALVTTIDDHSRKLLYGDFWEAETAWAHIAAVETVILRHGTGMAYYADNHAIFRFVSHRDSIWVNQRLGTDEATTQWRQCVEAAGMQVWYAMSPQAKGKVERPYRWLQDRIVRKCARDGVTRIEDGREVLAAELDRYNNHQVHSTTGEIPGERFQRAVAEGRTVFKPLQPDPPAASTKDIFCLRETRIVDGYRRISWQKHKLTVPQHIPVGARVQLHIIPEPPAPEVRLWYKQKLCQVYRFKA